MRAIMGRTSGRLAYFAALALPLLLSGCFVISTSRKLPVPKAPALVEAATPEELVARTNKRWDELQSLTATVELQLSVFKTDAGEATDYTTIRGVILLRKPKMLRVLGRVPVLGTRAFDMMSDGKEFTLWIPSKSKAIKGSNSLTKKSSSMMENLRPDFFFDAMVVRGLEKDDDYSVAADSETVEDASKKHLLFTPEYNLNIMRRKPGTHELTPVRVVTFHREDLLPYEQDLYDSEGNLETHVTYANYQDAGGDRYPSTITIRRPSDGFQIVITVQSVKENQPLTDDQFQFDIPPETEIQNLQ
jgi:outer membrane lipoprotein-sorting protein